MVRGKRIIVTGAYQGIGKETVRVLAENGANVIACSYIDDESFKQYCKTISEKNRVEIDSVCFDMSDDDSVKDAVKDIRSYKNNIDGLINIAGISKDALFHMVTKSDLVSTFQVNFFSQVLFSQYISKLMLKTGTGGSIVFTSSIAAIYGAEGQLAYSSSKAALIGAMKCMAIELGKHDIRVNAVAPGVISTPMTAGMTEEWTKGRVNKMDIPRLGSATEVANTFMFLVSDLSKHINGQVIHIDGGM